MGDLPVIRRVFVLSALELLRNRIGLVLFFAIPAIFLGIVVLTAGATPVPLKVFFRDETVSLLLSQEKTSLVFVSASVSGFISAYFSLVLFQQDFQYFRYCVFNGLRPTSLLLGRFALFFVMAVALAASITVALGQMVSLQQAFPAFIGFLLVATIYGAFGATAGMLSKEFLVPVMVSALLADIDAAWLQNPVYYTAAERMEIIRWLPAYYPCQLIFSSAFTGRFNGRALIGSGVWAGAMFLVLLSIIVLRMRGVVRRSPP